MCSSYTFFGDKSEIKFLHTVKFLDNNGSTFSVFVFEVHRADLSVEICLSGDNVLRGHLTLLLVRRTLLSQSEGDDALRAYLVAVALL